MNITNIDIDEFMDKFNEEYEFLSENGDRTTAMRSSRRIPTSWPSSPGTGATLSRVTGRSQRSPSRSTTWTSTFDARSALT